MTDLTPQTPNSSENVSNIAKENEILKHENTELRSLVNKQKEEIEILRSQLFGSLAKMYTDCNDFEKSRALIAPIIDQDSILIEDDMNLIFNDELLQINNDLDTNLSKQKKEEPFVTSDVMSFNLESLFPLENNLAENEKKRKREEMQSDVNKKQKKEEIEDVEKELQYVMLAAQQDCFHEVEPELVDLMEVLPEIL